MKASVVHEHVSMMSSIDVRRDVRRAATEFCVAVTARQVRRGGVLLRDHDGGPERALARGRADGVAAGPLCIWLRPRKLMSLCGLCCLLVGLVWNLDGCPRSKQFM